MRTTVAVQGARVHNLKNISVEIPRNSLTVVTGLPLKAHLDRLTGIREWVLRQLGGLTAADLGQTRAMASYDVSPVWAIHHVLQHEAEHRAHIAWIRDTKPD